MARKRTERELIKRVQERIDLAYEHDKENRIEASQDLHFLAGDQWPSDVRQTRESQSRPCLTLNRLPTYVNQVVNDFKLNPPAIKFVAADDDVDSDQLDIRNGILSEIQYKSNSVNIFGGAFANAVSCGIGHFRITTEYASDQSFDQEICIKRIPYPLSVYWDPDAVEPSRSDAKWCAVSEMMTESAFRETYPDADLTSMDIPSDDEYQTSSLFWRMDDLIRIAEYWEKVPVKRTLALLAGQAVDITDMKPEQLIYLPQIQNKRTVETFEIRQWLVSGAAILDGGREGNKWPGDHIPIVAVTGAEIPLEDRLIRHGLVRFARDPQQLYNYWQSAAAEMIALQPRAPFMATPKMIAKFKGQWDTQNTITRPYLLYEPDPEVPGGKPMREAPPQVPAAMLQSASVAVEDMKAITGIYDASLGNRTNETSGRAIIARSHQGDVGSYHYVENFNASLVHAGRILNDLIPKIYDGERSVRLPSDEHDEPKFARVNQVQLMANGMPMVANDLSQGKFDIRVKIGPSFATRRIEAVDGLMKLIQAYPALASVGADIVVNLLDIPKAEELAERLKRTMPPQIVGDDKDMTPEQQQAKQQAQQKQAQVEQMQEMMAQLEMALKKAQADKAGSEARLKDAEAMLKQIEAMMASQSQGQQMPQGPDPIHAEYGASLDNARKAADLRRALALATQAEVGTQGRALDNMLKQQKLGEEHQTGY